MDSLMNFLNNPKIAEKDRKIAEQEKALREMDRKLRALREMDRKLRALREMDRKIRALQEENNKALQEKDRKIQALEEENKELKRTMAISLIQHGVNVSAIIAATGLVLEELIPLAASIGCVLVK